jgi:ferric-dicitrate binding protein FerR (iron transport regulator)
MKKSILIKYIKGELTESEKAKVLEWAAKDKANELYIARLLNVDTLVNLPQGGASDREVDEILKKLKTQSFTNKKYYTINKKIFWSAASIVILAVVSTLLMLNSFERSPKEDTLLSQNIVNTFKYKNITPTKTLYTPRGVKARLVLPDSSQVWLNSDTWITYPDSFDSLVRSVTISGEAYFDVKKNPDRPMIVNTTKGFSIQVLGTQFNIKAYENDNIAQTTLYSGEIYLLRSENNKIVGTKISPNQTALINVENLKLNVTTIIKESPKNDYAWKEGKIIFESTPFPEVIKTLERWHGVDFVIKDREILKYKITATFNSESIVQIMDLIQMTTPVKYKIENRKVVLDRN